MGRVADGPLPTRHRHSTNFLLPKAVVLTSGPERSCVQIDEVAPPKKLGRGNFDPPVTFYH